MAKAAQAVEEKQDQQEDISQQDDKMQAQSVEFSEADGFEATTGGGSIDVLLAMNVSASVVIGQTELPVKRLLQLGPGSVLKLDKPIDEPADLYLRDTKFATGNIVVVDGRFAIRIKEILGLNESTAKAIGA
ncbi:MAG: FliM/FliN family flagellar motor switch protein [Planctomycetota bacterium]|jgi:flagellar motor switch protein FliN/FliY